MTVHLDWGSVDLTARGQDLRDMLAELFAKLGAKCDMPPEVQGTVTIDLRNATYRQALEALLGSEFTYTIGPHDTIFVHKSGTTWRPGWEEAA